MAAAEAFTVAAGHVGTATVSGGVVRVEIHYRIRTDILSMVGIMNAAGVGVGFGRQCGGRDRGVAMSRWGARRDRRQMHLLAWLSIAALGVVVVVVPIILYALGGSPFHHLGYTGANRVLSASRRSDDLQPAILWLTWGALRFAWISWAWMTVCVILRAQVLVDRSGSSQATGQPHHAVCGGVPGRYSPRGVR